MHPRSLHCAAALLLAMAALLLLPGQSRAGAATHFNTGWRAFHDLCEQPSRAKYRSSWMQVKRHFERAYKADTDGSFAPKSLYYLGRTYQELGKRSYLDQDFRQAIDYLQKVIDRFPSHSWSDDAKLYIARINLNHLQNKNQAYLDLLSIIHNYPDGDQVAEAKQLLKEMDKAYMEKVGVELSESEAKQVPDKSPAQGKGSKRFDTLTKLLRIRHWSSDDYTRVVLDLEEDASFEHFLLKPDNKNNKPYRLVLDLKKTWLPDDIQESLKIDDGILKRVRTGQYRKSVSRVVLDVQSLEDYRVFSLQSPFRVVVDVHAPSGKAKPASPASGGQSQIAINAKKKDLSSSLVTQLGLGIQTVMIDPGHGGKDPGAVCNGILEKDINLRMAKILGQILEDKGLEVIYTRKTDKFIPLEERTALANSKKADLFISLHVNAHKSSKVHGFEVYYLNLASSKDAVRVAARENSVTAKKISDLQVILTDLMLNSKIKESANLAEQVLDEALSYSQKFYRLNNHGVRQAPFYVLMGAKMPAVLVELGYITNYRERKRLQNYAYLKRMAWGISNGILAYRKQIKKFASLK